MPALDIVVVGGGLVGFGASIALARKGHRIRVLEASPSLQIVGDAIAAVANHSRVLDNWGLLEGFREVAPRDLGVMQFRRYDTSEVVMRRDMKSQAEEYGHPSYIFSRQGYLKFLHESAVRLGVQVHFDTRVDKVQDNSDRPAVIATNGVRFEADMIVGCDGVRSAIRAHMFPHIQCHSHTSCYRAIIPREQVANVPSLAEFARTMNFWMGPGRLVIQSNMADAGTLAVNLYQPSEDNGDESSGAAAGAWKTPGDPDEMRRLFEDFGPSLEELLGLVEECSDWKVVQLPPLPSWVSEAGRIILIGDAAHAFVPYTGQGCAAGMEDAATLAECISRTSSLDDLPRWLRACQDIRKPRVELMARTAETLGQVWKMGDGPGQVARDERMRKTPLYASGDWDGKPIDRVPESVQDPMYQQWVLSHDAVAYANRRLDSMGVER